MSGLQQSRRRLGQKKSPAACNGFSPLEKRGTALLEDLRAFQRFFGVGQIARKRRFDLA